MYLPRCMVVQIRYTAVFTRSPFPMRTLPISLLMLSSMLVPVAGCGSSGSNSSKPEPSAIQPVFTRTDNGIVTQAVLTDDKITMSSALPAGPTIIKVVNNGKKFHNFRVIGDGIDNSILDGLQPNQTG